MYSFTLTDADTRPQFNINMKINVIRDSLTEVNYLQQLPVLTSSSNQISALRDLIEFFIKI